MCQSNHGFSRKMDRKVFREFLHYNCNMTDDILMDRIYKYFNCVSADDIDRQEWVIGFNIFLKGQHISDILNFQTIFRYRRGADKILF